MTRNTRITQNGKSKYLFKFEILKIIKFTKKMCEHSTFSLSISVAIETIEKQLKDLLKTFGNIFYEMMRQNLTYWNISIQ